MKWILIEVIVLIGLVCSIREKGQGRIQNDVNQDDRVVLVHKRQKVQRRAEPQKHKEINTLKQSNYLERLSRLRKQSEKSGAAVRLQKKDDADDGKDGEDGADSDEPVLTDFEKDIFKYLEEFKKEMKEDSYVQRRKDMTPAKPPAFYPDYMKTGSTVKKKDDHLLKFIQHHYRTCVVPSDIPSIYDICGDPQIGGKQVQKDGESYKKQACKYYNCVNCCSNIKLIYKLTLLKYMPEAEKMGFKKGDYKSFHVQLEKMVPSSVEGGCYRACRKQYKFAEPDVAEDIINNDKLGISQKSPGYHCNDIKQNNNKAKESGIFYIRPKMSKKISKVYCDFETENGGWQLLYSYKKNENQKDFQIDGTNIPIDPYYGMSHTTLNQLEYQFNEISELRFLCITNNNNRFIHFITRNNQVILSAFNDDTSKLDAEIWKQDLESLSSPFLQDKFVQVFSGNDEELAANFKPVQAIPGKITEVNPKKVKKGGFLAFPFGTKKEHWNIDAKKKIFECGDQLSDEQGNNFNVLYQVWFRGRMLTKQQIKERNMKKQEE